MAEWASAKIIRAGIIGHIAVGIIYGKPLADILEMDWQKTFLSLGYVGLILIIFEGTQLVFNIGISFLALTLSFLGGLSARLDLLKANLVLSMLGAATGVCFPIGLSYLLLYLGFGYGETPSARISTYVHEAYSPRCCGNVHHRCSVVSNLSW